jgi:ferredoxin
VACTGCGICARNSEGAITMQDGLAVIDHEKLDPSIIPIEKCKTHAIGWLRPQPAQDQADDEESAPARTGSRT